MSIVNPTGSYGTPMQGASPGSGQLQVTCNRSSVSLVPGSQERVDLTLRNNGGSALAVEINVQGPPSQWLSLSQSSALLAPAQTLPVTLTLAAPQDAPTGSYPLAINVQSREDASVRVRLEFVFEIAEPGKISIELVPAQAEGQASADFQVRITTSGAIPVDVRLSASDNESACNYTFSPGNLLVSPYEAATSRLTVTARHPLAGVDTRTFPFTVNATTAQGISEMSQAQGRFIQKRLPPLELSIHPTRQSGPGQVNYSVSVVNPTEVQTIVRLTASDLEGACRYQFNPPTVTVPAKGVAPATLMVTPLQYHSEPGDILHTFTVRAQPTEGLLSPIETGATFLQTPMERPILSLTPSSQSSARAAAFTLHVSNPRATAMQVEITPTGGDGMCEFTVSPIQAVVPAQGRIAARLTVRPTSTLLPGEQRRTCPFTVQVHTTDLENPVEIQGSLIQVPGAPIGRWLTIAGAAALGLLLCVSLLWLASSAMNSLGSTLSNVAELKIPTPLPLATPIPVPSVTNTPTPLPTQAPPPPQAPPQAPTMGDPPKQPNGGGGGGGGPNTGATSQAATKTAQSATQTVRAQQTATAAAQQTANAKATATANAQTAKFAQYNGTWLNDDPNTRGITKLEVSNNGANITVHGYGKCTPTDCDWGTRTKAFAGEPFTILFEFGGTLKHQLTLTKEGSKLKVVDVGSASGTNTYLFHKSSIFVPKFDLPLITLVRP